MLRTEIMGGVLAVLFIASLGVAEEWVSLFDGKTLEGWTQKNGTATYRVEDGAIVGKTEKGSPNSFLCSDKNYGNFELEFEVKVGKALNSGVQIRSQTVGGTNDGRVNGPQVKIETGGTAGYIYGEATGRGWLTPDDQRKAHQHFQADEWNKYRVIAHGPRIQTWINEQPIADLNDEAIFKTHPSGFLGLQVHGVGNGGPFEVSWRNLRIKELD